MTVGRRELYASRFIHGGRPKAGAELAMTVGAHWVSSTRYGRRLSGLIVLSTMEMNCFCINPCSGLIRGIDALLSRFNSLFCRAGNSNCTLLKSLMFSRREDG